LPKLCIITCAYNERDSIMAVLERVRAVDLGAWEKEMIVVDNCSTDGTRELLQQIHWPEARVIFQPRNLGKGTSIRAGLAQATGDYAVIQDADFEYDPEELPLLLRIVDETGADAVFGSRTLGGRAIYKYARMYWGIRFFTWITNVLYGGQLTDVGTGTKMVRVGAARRLNLKGSGFELDFELPCKLLKAGRRIVESPISYHPRTFAEGKKINAIRDGLRTLWVILRVRFS
jgi:glycosyltransferase involved in cell wall biosynthesis